MRTKTINLCTFSELSDKAKENAISRLSASNVDYDWWEFIYEDAKTVGLKIKDFREYDCHARFVGDALECARLIVSNHGPDCDTYKDAEKFLLEFNTLQVDENGDIDSEDLENDFLYNLQEDYRIILRNEYEYLTCAESIIETIEANEYEFTEDGHLA